MSIRNRVRQRLSGQAAIAVWGAGGMGRAALARWLPRERIAHLVDSNARKQGSKLEDLEICAPETLVGQAPDCVVVCVSAYLEVFEWLDETGFKGEAYFLYDLFLPDNRKLSPLAALGVDLAVSRSTNWLAFFITKPQILVNVTYRLAAALRPTRHVLPIYWLVAWWHYTVCWVTSIQLPLSTEVGPGLLLAHPGTAVFTARARIGAFFTIYHCCTVGTTDSGDAPVIGDFVTVYTGSHVLGGCEIGSHTRVGAMSLLLDFKCDPASVVVGAPARTVRSFKTLSVDIKPS